MIQPDKVREDYGFRDANEKEDILTLSLLNTIRPVKNGKMMAVIDLASPFLVIGLCALIVLYCYKNEVAATMLALPILILFVYIPRIKESIERKLNSSGICHEAKKLGTHFLLGYGVCTEKKVITSGIRKRYCAKLRLQNGKILDDVLMAREVYDELKEGQRLVAAVADSPDAEQFVGVLPSLYNSRLSKEKTKKDEAVQKPDSNKMRLISDQERQRCMGYFKESRNQLLKEQNKNRVMIFLLPAILSGAASFVTDKIFFLDLALVLTACFIFMLAADAIEMRNVMKELRTGKELLVVDAVVADKPTMESEKKNAKGTVHAIDFEDVSGKLIHRSLKFEDRKVLEIGDEVLLVYRGKKAPLPCRKS